MKTLAAVLIEQNQPLQILELTIPPLKRGQALVKMAYSGLCHAQLNEQKGTKGPDPHLPHTLGHEGSGIVLDIGPDVIKVKPGDHVVLSWIKGKGIEVPNTTYSHGAQSINSGAVCTFLEKTVVSENRLIPIPKEFPLREAALLGCAIPTGAGVIFNEMNMQEGQSLIVFGAGGIGLSAIMAAHHIKANPIVAVDISEEKLEKAKKIGASHTFLPQDFGQISKLLPNGADFALESAGKKQVMEMAFASIKTAGGLCVLAGNLKKGEKIELNPFELIQGKRIIGTWGGKADIDRDVHRFAEYFLDKLTPLISHEVGLADINFLLNELSHGRVLRGLISLC